MLRAEIAQINGDQFAQDKGGAVCAIFSTSFPIPFRSEMGAVMTAADDSITAVKLFSFWALMGQVIKASRNDNGKKEGLQTINHSVSLIDQICI